MRKFSVTIAANMRAYAVIEIEATDAEAALLRAEEIAERPTWWLEPEMKDVVFDPAWDNISELEALEDVTEEI